LIETDRHQNSLSPVKSFARNDIAIAKPGIRKEFPQITFHREMAFWYA